MLGRIWLVRRLYRTLMETYFPVRYRTGTRYDVIVDEIARIRPRRILEVGTCRGAMAVRMVRGALAVSLSGEIDYWGFDLFDEIVEEVFHHEAAKPSAPVEVVEARLNKVVVKGRNARINLVSGNSKETLATVGAKLTPFDLIFIDGGHSLDTVRSDWKLTQWLCHARTTVFFDDYPRWGVGQTIDEIDKRLWQVEIIEPGDSFKVNEQLVKSKLVRVTKR